MKNERSRRKNALMILGTASHVGKSIITAGLGRVFADDGYRVVPFKAQNMSLNSAATPDGGEIGRAQALQAEACRVCAEHRHESRLLKPSTDTGAQVVLLGKIWGQVTASDYHTRRVEQLFPDVHRRLSTARGRIRAGFARRRRFSGGDQPRTHDIANMRMAKMPPMPPVCWSVISIAAAFSHPCWAPSELLDADDRARIRGFIINKFRGDESAARPGVA